MEFRIGINLPDVIEDRGDVYGDGVNIAARLEQLAEPGGIAVSDAIRAAVGTKLDLQFQYIGEYAQALRSIETAMRLDPHYRDAYLHIRAQAYFHAGQHDAAIAALQRRLIRRPDSDTSSVPLAAAYGHPGRLDEVRAEWSEALRVNPRCSLEHRSRILPCRHERDSQYVVGGLREAGLA